MEKRMLTLAAVLGLLSFAVILMGSFGSDGVTAEAGPDGESGQEVPGRFIVGLQAGVNEAAVARDHRVRPDKVYESAVRGFVSSMSAEQAEALKADKRVRYVEPDRIVTLEAEQIPTGIRRIFADSNSNLQINGVDDMRVDVDIAIIDTGIDNDHPDLNVVRSVDCRNGCSIGGEDGNGHGTHVAGTSAALDNGFGVVGVAPGARLWAVQVLSANGSGYISDVVAGIDYVTAHAGEIEVANMSLGCACTSQALDEAITNSVQAGVVHVVAAGNSSTDASSHSPANHPDVITVSALADFDGEPGGLGSSTCRSDADDTLANFSNYGSAVEITAPGVCIYSTWKNGGYNTISGTSMAAPHVAGAAALLASGGASVDTIRNTVINTGSHDWVDDSGDGIKEPLLDVSDTSVFGPGLVPADEYPSLSIVNPANGATVAGIVTVTAEANDDDSVTQVVFFIDGPSIGIDTNGADGWSADWDTTSLGDNTTHMVAAAATDSAGHVTYRNLSVTVNNGDQAPTISLTNPVDGDTLSGTVTVTAPVSDDNGVTQVEFYLDGKRAFTLGQTGTSYTAAWNWNTDGTPDGPHSLYAAVTDTVGQKTASQSLSITVNNGTGDKPPTVAIISPTDGATVSGTVTITASAIDDWNVSRFDFLVDGSTIAIVFPSPSKSLERSADWDTTWWSDGPHTVTVRVTDSAGQTASASVSVVVANSATDSPPTVSITSPVSSSSVTGSVTVSATADDDNGVSKVDFFVDGVSIGTDTSGSDGWSAFWDSTKVADGTHTVLARATDTAGQTASDDVLVKVDNGSAPAPVLNVTGVDPASITLSSGNSVTVTISGTGFATGVKVALEGGAGPSPSVRVISVSSTSIKATLTFKDGGPPKPRAWDLRVTNPNGETDVLAKGFTVYQ